MGRRRAGDYWWIIASHEIMSAYVALKEFSDKIKRRGADTALVVRMICGVPYSTEGIPEEGIMKKRIQECYD